MAVVFFISLFLQFASERSEDIYLR